MYKIVQKEHILALSFHSKIHITKTDGLVFKGSHLKFIEDSLSVEHIQKQRCTRQAIFIVQVVYEIFKRILVPRVKSTSLVAIELNQRTHRELSFATTGTNVNIRDEDIKTTVHVLSKTAIYVSTPLHTVSSLTVFYSKQTQ